MRLAGFVGPGLGRSEGGTLWFHSAFEVSCVILQPPGVLNFRLSFDIPHDHPKCKVEKDSGRRNQNESSRRTFNFAKCAVCRKSEVKYVWGRQDPGGPPK